MITDEMVEKAAKAIAQRRRSDWHGSLEDQARAALAAVLPDIVEQCAKIAETKYTAGSPYMDVSQYTAANIAKEIRALASLSFQDGKT